MNPKIDIISDNHDRGFNPDGFLCSQPGISTEPGHPHLRDPLFLTQGDVRKVGRQVYRTQWSALLSSFFYRHLRNPAWWAGSEIRMIIIAVFNPDGFLRSHPGIYEVFGSLRVRDPLIPDTGRLLIGWYTGSYDSPIIILITDFYNQTSSITYYVEWHI